MQIFSQMLSILALLLYIYGFITCLNLLHPQYYICNSDIIILARIKHTSSSSDDNEHILIVVERHLEGRSKSNLSLDNRTLLIKYPPCASIKKINVGELYVMAMHFNQDQNKLTIERCGYFKPYSNLTIEEAHGISGNYKRGCDCKIRYCLRGCQKKSRMECIWSSKNWYLMASLSCLPIDHDECTWSRHGVKTNLSINRPNNYHILHKRTFHSF